MIISIDDFLDLRRSLPVVDVRSENEFAEGHVRDALNIAILNNSERAAVGTDYKQKGQAEAIKTGFRLVGPRFLEIINKAERVACGIRRIKARRIPIVSSAVARTVRRNSVSPRRLMTWMPRRAQASRSM